MAAGSPQRQDSMILDIEVDLNIPSTMFYLTKKWPSPLSFKERETPLHPAIRGVAGTLWLSFPHLERWCHRNSWRNSSLLSPSADSPSPVFARPKSQPRQPLGEMGFSFLLVLLLLLLLSRFSRVRLCVTPLTAAHQAPPSLGFSRQKHWSGLPFPSPMHENENWKWSHLIVSNS